MKYLIFITMLLLATVTQAKTLTYTWLNNTWFCEERVSTGRNSSELVLKRCNTNNLWFIYNRDDLVFKRGVNINTITFNEYAAPKYVKFPCGIYYNPKDGKTYKYSKCIVTYK